MRHYGSDTIGLPPWFYLFGPRDFFAENLHPSYFQTRANQENGRFDFLLFIQGNTFSDKMNKAKTPSTLSPIILENAFVLYLRSCPHGDGVLATETKLFESTGRVKMEPPLHDENSALAPPF